MSGGGKTSADVTQIDPAIQNIKPVVPEWLKDTGPLEIPRGAPGQLAGLAHDMAGGGFGNPKANLRYLNNSVYDPVLSTDFFLPQKSTNTTATPKTPAAPVSPAAPTANTGQQGKAGKSVSSYRWANGKLVPVQDRMLMGRNSR